MPFFLSFAACVQPTCDANRKSEPLRVTAKSTTTYSAVFVLESVRTSPAVHEGKYGAEYSTTEVCTAKVHYQQPRWGAFSHLP